MRDSIGGVVNVFMIAVFLLIVSGYLAFSVSYNKAFRLKNKIINILEKNGSYDNETKDEINDFIKKVGYNATVKTNVCNYVKDITSDKKYNCENGYCAIWIDTSDKNSQDGSTGYFKVITSVHVDVPIINKILPYLEFLYVSGDTITINGMDSKFNNGSSMVSTC